MTSIEATGPPGMACVPPARVWAARKPLKFWAAPWATMTIAPRTDKGTNTRTRLRVRSAQKLPTVRAWPAIPRTTARATDRPTAAALNWATTSPAIWAK